MLTTEKISSVGTQNVMTPVGLVEVYHTVTVKATLVSQDQLEIRCLHSLGQRHVMQ